jgi:hypothetical protein
MKKIVVLAAAAFLAAACVSYADAPKTVDTIPVFPGAVKDASQPEKDSVFYTVDAWPEEVFNWYQGRLGAAVRKSDDWRGTVERNTSVGATCAVVYEARAIGKDEIADLTKTQDMKDSESKVIGRWDGEWVKSIFQSRPRTTDGWLWGGSFQWGFKKSMAATIWLEVDVDSLEMSLAGGGRELPLIDGIQKKVNKKTGLVLRATKPAPEWFSRAQNLDAENLAKLQAMDQAPPTDKDLGVPLYPRAELNFDMLIQNPVMIGYLYPYTTVDPVESVVTFYEKATGKKALRDDKGGVAILVKGNSVKTAELAVSAQPVGQGQTLVFVLKNMNNFKPSGQGGASPAQQKSAPAAAAQPQQPQAAAAPAAPAAAAAAATAAPTPQAAPKARIQPELARSGSPNDILAAVKNGANVNEVDAAGFTPLMYAAMSNPNPGVISALVAAGASVDIQNADGMTALMLAAKLAKKSAVVQALIDAHANMKLKDANGKNAFDYSTGNSALFFSSQQATLMGGR